MISKSLEKEKKERRKGVFITGHGDILLIVVVGIAILQALHVDFLLYSSSLPFFLPLLSTGLGESCPYETSPRRDSKQTSSAKHCYPTITSIEITLRSMARTEEPFFLIDLSIHLYIYIYVLTYYSKFRYTYIAIEICVEKLERREELYFVFIRSSPFQLAGFFFSLSVSLPRC